MDMIITADMVGTTTAMGKEVEITETMATTERGKKDATSTDRNYNNINYSNSKKIIIVRVVINFLIT